MPPNPERPISTTSCVCQWVNLRQALHHFATYTGPTQSQQHIKPLHWYVACRLVLEGGFHPDNITPRPPFAVVTRRGENALQFAPNWRLVASGLYSAVSRPRMWMWWSRKKASAQ